MPAIAVTCACQPGSMCFRTASVIALAGAGELDAMGRRLDEAERLAGMWNGGPWVAAVWEARRRPTPRPRQTRACHRRARRGRDALRRAPGARSTKRGAGRA